MLKGARQEVFQLAISKSIMWQLATHFNHLKYNSQFGKQKSINKYTIIIICIFDKLNLFFTDNKILHPKTVFRSSPKNTDSSFDNDEEVDVEQWSDSEDTKSIKTEDHSNKNRENSNPENNNSDQQQPPAKKKKKEPKEPKFLKPKCNSEELLHIDCYLETKELWDKFNELGTEMIITKTGR